jgi:hypothetical protein
MMTSRSSAGAWFETSSGEADVVVRIIEPLARRSMEICSGMKGMPTTARGPAVSSRWPAVG